MPFELAQSCVAARLCVHDHPIDSLKILDFGRQGPRGDVLYSQPLRSKLFIHFFNGLRIAGCPSLCKFVGRKFVIGTLVLKFIG